MICKSFKLPERLGGWCAALGCLALAAFITGCSEHHEPPMERIDLVSRFFNSVRLGDFATAARQGRKLYDMDRNNSFLLHLVTIHESNAFLRSAQKSLNSGDVTGALRTLEEGRRLYPEIRTLSMYYSRLSQLRNAKKLLTAMEKASSSAAMSASLTAAATGLGANTSPELAAYFRRYEARIAKVAERERKQAEKAEALMPPQSKQPPEKPARSKLPPEEPARPKLPPEEPQL